MEFNNRFNNQFNEFAGKIDDNLLGSQGGLVRALREWQNFESYWTSPRPREAELAKAGKWYTFLSRLENSYSVDGQWRSTGSRYLLDHCWDENTRFYLFQKAVKEAKGLDVIPDYSASKVLERLITLDPGFIFNKKGPAARPLIFETVECSCDIIRFAIDTRRAQLQAEGYESDAIKSILLDHLSGSDRSGNTIFSSAVLADKEDIARLLLDFDPSLANIEDNALIEVVRQGRSSVLGLLAENDVEIASQLPRLIIQHSLSGQGGNLWEALSAYFAGSVARSAESSQILHEAVFYRRCEIVEALVLAHPEMVLYKDGKKKIALFYNNVNSLLATEEEEVQKRIRAAIVPAIIRQTVDTGKIQELLNEARDMSYQACLDFEEFNLDKYDFRSLVDALVESLSTSAPNGTLACDVKFEAILRHVNFPDLDRMKIEPNRDLMGRSEVPDLFEWLSRKGVKSIFNIIIPDSLHYPHDEDSIVKALTFGNTGPEPVPRFEVDSLDWRREPLPRFEVDSLDWRRMDMSIEVLRPLRYTLRKLHLYHSGNWAVLSHWKSLEGVEMLTSLEELNVTIVRDCLNEHQAKEAVIRTKNVFANIRDRLEKPWKLNVDCKTWSKDISAASIGTANNAKSSTTSSVSVVEYLKMKTFLECYEDYQNRRQNRSSNSTRYKKLERVRIALLDTGLVAISRQHRNMTSRTGRIKQGDSFANLGKNPHTQPLYWFASNEHGHAMASIIWELDPYCEIYPVQVTTKNHIDNIDSVVQAIRWAIKQGVHIISMSLVLWTDSEELEKAIREAEANQIVVMCSTADHGNNQQRVYPAFYCKDGSDGRLGTRNVIPIAACNAEGKLLNYSSETEALFHFIGENVSVERPPFSKNTNKESVSGSSVATAVAVGIASLVIACFNMVHEGEARERPSLVSRFFHKMRPAPGPGGDLSHLKYCIPARIFHDNFSKDPEDFRNKVADIFGGNLMF